MPLDLARIFSEDDLQYELAKCEIHLFMLVQNITYNY